MSGNLAFAFPHHSPRRQAPDAPTRHIEIVATRKQRLARPRLVYSLIIVGGLFAVLVSQLLLSIALADGAYQISALQAQQKELSRERQAVTEELNVLNSPQNLAALAESLGMVSNSSAVYLNLADGAVMGAPTAAGPDAGSVVGANGSLLIANSLLTGVPSTTKTDGIRAAGDTTSGAPAGTPPAGSVASTPTALPAPVTR